MSDKNFETNKTIQSIFNRIADGRNTEEAMEGLEAASILIPEARTFIADKLEKTMLAELLEGAPEAVKRLKKNVAALEEARKNNPAELSSLQNVLAESLCANELFKFVSENKGAAAGPLVKAYVEEAGKLSNEEYALPENILKAFCTAIEKVKASKANPFRPNTPGM